MTDLPKLASNRHDAWALLFAVIFPTFVTLVYFQWLQDSESAWQQAAYGIGKVLQFGFPIVFVGWFHRERIWGTRAYRDSKISPSASGPALPQPVGSIPYAIGFGLAVGSAMLAIFFTTIPTDVAAKLQTLVVEKISSIGIDRAWKYAALTVFYAICHSLMEEYYWRWFVYHQLKAFFSSFISNVLSSLGFMAHHVVVLGFYFGWSSPLTYLLSLSVALGGSFWAWLYQRDGNLLSCWISHAIVDAAIFGLGYWMVGGEFGS
jgi:membrane protease YdiL (CAAX protease family)